MQKPTTPDIRLITLDLDDTLLNSDKHLSPRNEAVLRRAAEAGVEIVPASGRFYDAFPEEIRRLDFVHYIVAVNGAEIRDLRSGKPILTAELPLDVSLRVMEYLDSLPVIYDCYMDGWGWMTAELQAKAAEFAPNRHYLDMLLNKRSPVPELKAFLREKGRDIQKIQFFIKIVEEMPAIMEELSRRFPEVSITSSISNNVEINAPKANKGAALIALADYLGLEISQTMSFGDQLNDLSMIRTAGLGVAMGNAVPELKAEADYITIPCNDDGVAFAVEKFCFTEES